MLSWKEVTDNFKTGLIDYANLCDEDLMKYYIMCIIQINIFNELDAGNDISNDYVFENNILIDNKEGTFLQLANVAKMAHNYLQVLQEIIKNHLKDEEYLVDLYNVVLLDYANYAGIDLSG